MGFNLDGYYSIDFYVKKETLPNANGKYEDFIGVVDNDFIIHPEMIGKPSVLYAVYAGNLPDPDDDNYEDRLSEENNKLYNKYVVPYIKKGRKVSINRLDFESDNMDGYDDEDDPTGIRMELCHIIQMALDEGEDADDGCCLYRM